MLTLTGLDGDELDKALAQLQQGSVIRQATNGRWKFVG
jgi:hypothetical protein